MVMIARRPHILHYTIIQEALPPYRDENGNMIFPTPTEIEGTVKCRVEPLKTNPYKPVTDGSELIYEFLIFADWITINGKRTTLSKGTKVRATDPNNGEIMAEGEIADFANDQRQCRIWI